MEPDNYVVELSEERWQLVVDCIEFVRETASYSHPESLTPINRFCRDVTRAELERIVNEIASNVSTVRHAAS